MQKSFPKNVRCVSSGVNKTLCPSSKSKCLTTPAPPPSPPSIYSKYDLTPHISVQPGNMFVITYNANFMRYKSSFVLHAPMSFPPTCIVSAHGMP